MSVYKKRFLIAFCLAFIVSAFLWIKSDTPPYGEPGNELSNNYWGYTVHIARAWRSGDFSFWNRELGGGLSLYTGGQYPVLNPTNVFAFVLNDDQFFLLKLIEPYFVGIFFMCLFLLELVPVPIAIGGALAYMGLLITRQTPMAESSIFLYGCALFPAMALAALKFRSKPIVGASLSGAILAFQFSGQGVIQIPQMVTWWTIFYLVLISREHRSSSLWQTCVLWAGCTASFVLLTVGLFGAQFIPTAIFTVTESARISNHYPVNNFPVFSLQNTHDLIPCLIKAIIGHDGISARGFLFLVFYALAFYVFGRRCGFKHSWDKGLLSVFFWTTGVYSLLPTIAGALAASFPLMEKLFAPMKSFTFLYGIHTIDFCLIVFFCVVISESSTFNALGLSKLKRAGFLLLLGLAYIWAIIPVVVRIIALKYPVMNNPFIDDFCYASSLWTSGAVAVCVTLLLIRIFIKTPVISFCAAAGMILLGFMTVSTCWNWNNKGSKTHLASFAYDSPEHMYYRNQQGKFYLPFETLPFMADDYNLLSNVKGTSGFVPIPPLRLNRFITNYHRNAPKESWTSYHFNISHPSSGLTTFFPVDFTTCAKGYTLPWPHFSKAVDGDQLDVWVRTEAPERVLFAHELKIKDFNATLEGFDKFFDGEMWVDPKDAEQYKLTPGSIPIVPDKPLYSNFEQIKDDEIHFKVRASSKALIIVPEMFQNGWSLYIDGKKQSLFPAWSLFLGFEMPAGEHNVHLRFIPQGLYLGIIMMAGSILYLIYLWRRKSKCLNSRILIN